MKNLNWLIVKTTFSKLSKAERDMFRFFREFEKSHNIYSNIHVHMLEDQLHKTETDTCGVFQLYFYEKLFGPKYNNVIFSHKALNKNTVQTLLNELIRI